jgi:isopenicillin N synthase-like dioxygenase
VIDFLSWTSPFNVSPEDRLETARELVEACHTTGFVYITNHGISPELLGEAFAMSKKFFDLPTEKKMTAGNAGSQSFRGYSWPGLENSNAISDEGTKVPGTEKEVVDFNVRNKIRHRMNVFPNGVTGMLRSRLRLQYPRHQCLASPRRPPQLPVFQHKVLLGVLAHLTAYPQSCRSRSRSPG